MARASERGRAVGSVRLSLGRSGQVRERPHAHRHGDDQGPNAPRGERHELVSCPCEDHDGQDDEDANGDELHDIPFLVTRGSPMRRTIFAIVSITFIYVFVNR